MSRLPRQPALASIPGGVTPLALVAATVAILTAVFLIYRSMPLVRAATLTIARADTDDLTKPRLDRFNADLEQHVARVDGRSLFFIPARPPPPRPPDPPPIVTGPPGPPPPPSTYAGPAVIASVYDTVWFENGERVQLGEEAAGVKVLAIQAPWTVTLLWRGIEFSVPLFARDTLGVASSTTTDTPAADPNRPEANSPNSPNAAVDPAVAANEAANRAAWHSPDSPSPGGSPPPPDPENTDPDAPEPSDPANNEPVPPR